MQDGEEAGEQQRAQEEHPRFAAELPQQLGAAGGSIVTAADVALLDEAHDPAGQAEQDQHQHRAEEELPDLGVVLRDVGVHGAQQQRTHDRTEERVDPAQQDHQQHLGRLRPVRQVGIDAAVVDHDPRTRQAGEGSHEHEGVEPVAIDGDADEIGPLGILANRRQRPAERRIDDVPQAVDRDDADHQHELVVVGEGRLGDPLRHRNADQAVVATGEVVPFEGDQVDDVAERQRQDGEVDVGATHAEIADDQRRQRAADRCHDQPEPEGEAGDVLEQQACRVAADAEIGGLAERDHAGVAHQKVERHGEQRPDEDLGRELDPEFGPAHGEDQLGQPEQQQQRRHECPQHRIAHCRPTQRNGFSPDRVLHAGHGVSPCRSALLVATNRQRLVSRRLPSKPWGLVSSTITMRT